MANMDIGKSWQLADPIRVYNSVLYLVLLLPFAECASEVLDCKDAFRGFNYGRNRVSDVPKNWSKFKSPIFLHSRNYISVFLYI
jgi:hypothetical protein